MMEGIMEVQCCSRDSAFHLMDDHPPHMGHRMTCMGRWYVHHNSVLLRKMDSAAFRKEWSPTVVLALSEMVISRAHRRKGFSGRVHHLQ